MAEVLLNVRDHLVCALRLLDSIEDKEVAPHVDLAIGRLDEILGIAGVRREFADAPDRQLVN